MSAEEFQQALQRGDFGAAAKELQDLLDHPDQLSPQEKQAAADHLRDTASRLENAESKNDPGIAEQKEQIEQALRDQGLTPEQIDQVEKLLKDHLDHADHADHAPS